MKTIADSDHPFSGLDKFSHGRPQFKAQFVGQNLSRADIVSVGLAVEREMDRDSPDFDFLIAVNENIAAGLAGQA